VKLWALKKETPSEIVLANFSEIKSN
jgi:hypothetical protein